MSLGAIALFSVYRLSDLHYFILFYFCRAWVWRNFWQNSWIQEIQWPKWWSFSRKITSTFTPLWSVSQQENLRERTNAIAFAKVLPWITPYQSLCFRSNFLIWQMRKFKEKTLVFSMPSSRPPRQQQQSKNTSFLIPSPMPERQSNVHQ